MNAQVKRAKELAEVGRLRLFTAVELSEIEGIAKRSPHIPASEQHVNQIDRNPVVAFWCNLSQVRDGVDAPSRVASTMQVNKIVGPHIVRVYRNSNRSPA